MQRRGGVDERLVKGPDATRVIAHVTAGGTVRSLLHDATDNVSHVVEDGTVEGDANGPTPRRYRAFGELRSGASGVERGYTGQPAEGPTGLIYMAARHYDPSTGRFLQQDPLGVEADQLYAYAANDPFRFADPSGLRPNQLTDFYAYDSWDPWARLTAGPPARYPQVAGDDPVVIAQALNQAQSQSDSLGVQVAALGAGVGTGALVGGGTAYVVAGLTAVCLPCGVAVGVGALAYAGYELYQDSQNDFAGIRGFGSSVGNVLSGNATAGEAFQVGFVGGSIAGGVAGSRAGYAAGRLGSEIRIGSNLRVAPFGNRTGHPTGRFTHYHRRVPDPSKPGQGLPGQGIGRHRPWDTRSTDTSFWDRF